MFFSSHVQLPTCKLKVNRELDLIRVGILLFKCKERRYKGGGICKRGIIMMDYGL